MEIKFNCTAPSCQQRICVDSSWGGREIPCPVCSTLLQIPSPSDLSPAVPRAGVKHFAKKIKFVLVFLAVCIVGFAGVKIYRSIHKQRELIMALTPTDAYRAVQKGDLTQVKWLLDHRPDFLTRPVNPKRSTMLHVAVSSGRVPLVEELLRRKANVNAQDAFGATPLHDCFNPDIATLLLDHGADMTLKTRYGLTVLQTATSRHRTEVIRVLREHGAKEQPSIESQ